MAFYDNQRVMPVVVTGATELPLPDGAATESTLQDVEALVSQITTPSDTQPVSAVALPLPAGAATESTLQDVEALVSQLTTPLDTQPVSVATLPLPAGAATEATLNSLAAKDFATQTTLATRASEATLATLGTQATLATRASEATLATLAAKDFATQATLATRASEATLATLGTQATLATRASEATLAAFAAVAATSARQVAPGTAGTPSSEVQSVQGVANMTPLKVEQIDLATFTVSTPATAVGNGKSMLSLVNAGSAVIRIHKIFMRNAQISGVTGVACEFQLRRITGHSSGTALTPMPHDTNDATAATAQTGATVSGESASSIDRAQWSTDEWGPGTSDVESADHVLQQLGPTWGYTPPIRPIVLRAGQGLSVRCNTNTTAGTFDVVIIYTEV